MQNKSPEERSAIAAKARATRKANIAARVAAREEALTYANGLRQEINGYSFFVIYNKHETRF